MIGSVKLSNKKEIYPLGNPTNVTAVAGDEQVTIKWTDPDDLIVGGYDIAIWEKTVVVRKTGSAPTSASDGTVVVTETTRNQYSSTGYVDTGLTNGTTYYYGIFPATTKNIYNTNVSIGATPYIIYPSAATNLVATGDKTNLKFTLTFTFPSNATKATAVMKAGSAPTSASDGTAKTNLTSGSATFTGVLTDTTYYFKVYTYNAKNRETASGSVTGFIKGLDIVTFANGTDAQIKAMLDAHYNNEIDITDYWAVGDTRVISLNQVSNPCGSGDAWPAQNITIVITAMSHHSLATSINGHTKSAITCQTRECINNLTTSGGADIEHIYPMLASQSLYNDYAWAGSTQIGLRTWGNGAFYSTMLPTGTKNMIKEITRTVKNNHTGTTTTTATDKIFLPTEGEIFGSNHNTNVLEGTQWKYYETSSNRKKYGNNSGNPNSTAQEWWNGSPYSTASYWCTVADNGYSMGYVGTYACGFAPAFCM